EDGIRDKLVTGVQTCALPIYLMLGFVEEPVPQDDLRILHERAPELYEIAVAWPLAFKRGLHELIQPDKTLPGASEVDAAFPRGRSEERRVGKECRWRGWPQP